MLQVIVAKYPLRPLKKGEVILTGTPAGTAVEKASGPVTFFLAEGSWSARSVWGK